MTTIIFQHCFSCKEAKYSSECIANTLQNYPELYKNGRSKGVIRNALLLT